MKSLLFILAAVAGGYAIVSGIFGFLTDAGLGVAVAMTAWLIAYLIGHRQREWMRQRTRTYLGTARARTDNGDTDAYTCR
jgi:hypothetical protein